MSDPLSEELEKSDLELWSRIAARGDANAFACLFDRHASTIYNYAFRRCGDWSTAEEIVAMTFLETWRRRQSVTFDGDSARPWLLGVATNVLRNSWRSRRRFRVAVERLAGRSTEAVWEEDEIVRRLVADQTREVLAEAIERLSRRQRDVVWLCLVEDATYREAAESLGIPVGTVRSRLSRARQQLRGDSALELFWVTGHGIGSDDTPVSRKTT
ncbi:MAG: RNA polymerase sigma factor [Actinobacteria bacterium]|nr:RNA polymerase sigma factor [Actinomycetota bacterium]